MKDIQDTGAKQLPGFFTERAKQLHDDLRASLWDALDLLFDCECPQLIKRLRPQVAQVRQLGFQGFELLVARSGMWPLLAACASAPPGPTASIVVGPVCLARC